MHKFWTSLSVALLICVAPLISTSEHQIPSPVPAGETAAAVPAIPRLPGYAPVNVDAAVAAGASRDVLMLALEATACGVASGDLSVPPTLTVIDYSRPSTEPRLWVFDLRSGELLFAELVAHGQGTGENMARHFSDRPNSRQSSIGLFVTGETYVGRNGYSLRMDGLEPGFNGHARERAIVMHGAPYVSEAFAETQGRLGRSWGCPALREAVAREVIDTVRDGGVVFAYYPDPEWLERSRFFRCRERLPSAEARL